MRSVSMWGYSDNEAQNKGRYIFDRKQPEIIGFFSCIPLLRVVHNAVSAQTVFHLRFDVGECGVVSVLSGEDDQVVAAGQAGFDKPKGFS